MHILYGGFRSEPACRQAGMNILFPNINHSGQKDSSFEVRHKA